MRNEKKIYIGNYAEFLGAMEVLKIIAEANPLKQNVELQLQVPNFIATDTELGFELHRFHFLPAMRAQVKRDMREIHPDEIKEYQTYLSELIHQCLLFIIFWLTSEDKYPELDFDVFSSGELEKVKYFNLIQLFEAQSRLLSLYRSHMRALNQPAITQAGTIETAIRNHKVSVEADKALAIQFAIGIQNILKIA